MTGFYLFVSSIDSSHYHENNTYYDFIVELGRPYDLSESSHLRSRNRWNVALVEAKLEDVAGLETPFIPEEVLICCDLVQPSYIRGSERKVLRQLGLTGSGQIVSTYQPYYISLATQKFARLEVHLLDRDLKPVSHRKDWPLSQTWKLSCTLHFQRT